MSETGQRAILLVGSPRGWQSTSAALGGYLLDRLAEGGMATERFRTGHQPTDSSNRGLTDSLAAADMLILSFPLYVDSLPALLIAALEEIRREKDPGQPWSAKRIVAMVNCGFPEPEQCRTALAICQRFAAEVGMHWAGGLALGSGGAVSGKPLPELGDMVRHVRDSLDISAAALLAGEDIPAAAAASLAKPIIPYWLYTLAGNRSWRAQAKSNGVLAKINERPYQ